MRPGGSGDRRGIRPTVPEWLIWSGPSASSARSRLLSVLPLTRLRVLVNAGQLVRRRILEDLVCRFEDPLFLAAVPAIPDEVTDDREDRSEEHTAELQPH